MPRSYPRGKLNAHDEGELELRLGLKDGTIILHFGKPVVWLGFSYEAAKALGEALLKKAEEIKQ